MNSKPESLFSEQFAAKWKPLLEEIVNSTGLKAILVMESLPEHLRIAVTSGPFREIYHRGAIHEKGAFFNKHKLYCEQVIMTESELHVPDSASDPEWINNEDFVQFGLGTYLGFPLRYKDEILGTVCALHDKPYAFREGSPSAYDLIRDLRDQIEKSLDS